jgi:hypothetical protein
MRQRTFSSLGFERHGKQTRRQRFLAEMDTIVPWRKLCRLIEPHYPKGDRGRPPIGVERMLRHRRRSLGTLRRPRGVFPLRRAMSAPLGGYRGL